MDGGGGRCRYCHGRCYIEMSYEGSCKEALESFPEAKKYYHHCCGTCHIDSSKMRYVYSDGDHWVVCCSVKIAVSVARKLCPHTWQGDLIVSCERCGKEQEDD